MMAMFYEAGRYTCRVVDQGIKPASTGKDMVVMTVQPQARMVLGPEGENPEYCTQQYDRTIRLVVNPESKKQIEMMLKKLRYAGFTGESFDDLNLVGTDVECECTEGEYNGQPSEQWDLALPPIDRKPLTPIDKPTTRKLDALFGKLLKQPAAARTEPQPQWAPTEDGPGQNEDWSPPPPADDGVPF